MNLLEAFVKLDEDAFDTTPKGIEDLSNFMDDADVVDDEIEIIDPDIDFGDDDTMPADDEESEEENAHVGQLVLQCNTCNALVYKDKDEVELDDEGNVEEEECPNCHNVSKFDVIGKICTVDDLEDELEGDEEESEEKEEDESEKPEEESEEEVEVDDEEEKSIKEESLRRPRKKSLKENRQKLNEGPGAGYTVSGDLTDIRINSFDFKVNGDEVVVNCDIDADMENVEAYSYYYGGEVGYEVPVKISQVSYYIIYGDSQLNDSDVEEELEYDLSHLKFKAYVGGGWSHSTFDGNLEVKDTRHWNGEDSDIFNVIMHCTDEEDIQFIDDLVTGNSEYSEKNDEEFDESLRRNRKVRKESLRRPDKNRKLVEAPAGDFSYFKSNGNDEMSYNRDALRYAKSLLKRHYLDKIHSSSMDDFSKNIGILNDAVKFVDEEFGQDIKSSGSIPRYRELNQESPVNTICNGYLDLCNDIEKSFNDCYYIWFNSCRDGDDKFTQTPPGLDYTATFSIFDESCIFKIRTTPEGIEEYTRFINLPDSVNCKNTYKLAENIVSLIPELKSQFSTFTERKLDEISIRLNQKLDRSLFTFIPLDELREKIKQSMILKESVRRPRNKSLKEDVEQLNFAADPDEMVFYIFPKLNAEDIRIARSYSLYPEDGLGPYDDSTVISGRFEDLVDFSNNYLDYQLVDGYLFDENGDEIETTLIYPDINDFDESLRRKNSKISEKFTKKSSTKDKILKDIKKLKKESLEEDLEGITVDTDEETIQITQKEDGGVAVETSPKESDESFMEEPMFEEPSVEGDEISGDEEVIEPLTDGEEEEIAEENPESEEDEEEIEDIDSDSFDELGESYLKESYENVKSFKTSKVYKKNDKLVVEGIVSFKSGKNKKTSFIFESAHNKSKKKVLLGENKQITPNSKSFRLRGVVKNKKMVCESLRYNYKEGKNRVSGVCRVK